MTRRCTNISVGIHAQYLFASYLVRSVYTVSTCVGIYLCIQTDLYDEKKFKREKNNNCNLFFFRFLLSIRRRIVVSVGVFLLEQERYPEAAAQLVEAVDLEPDDYDLTVTAATALRQAGVSLRAEEMYRKAAMLRPRVSEIYKPTYLL